MSILCGAVWTVGDGRVRGRMCGLVNMCGRTCTPWPFARCVRRCDVVRMVPTYGSRGGHVSCAVLCGRRCPRDARAAASSGCMCIHTNYKRRRSGSSIELCTGTAAARRRGGRGRTHRRPVSVGDAAAPWTVVRGPRAVCCVCPVPFPSLVHRAPDSAQPVALARRGLAGDSVVGPHRHL